MHPHHPANLAMHQFSRPRVLLQPGSNEEVITVLRRLSEYVDFVDVDAEMEQQLGALDDIRDAYDGAVVPSGPRKLDIVAQRNLATMEHRHFESHEACSHFLTAVFANADTRRLLEAASLRGILELRDRYDHVLEAADPEVAGRLMEMARVDRLDDSLLHAWLATFRDAVQVKPRPVQERRILEEMLGRFDQVLADVEKGAYLRLLDVAQQSATAMAVAKATMVSWSLRYEHGFLANQAFLRPFPHELVLLWSSEQSWADPTRRRLQRD